MATALIIFGIFILLIAMVVPVIFLEVRRIFREQKSFERGLKMVPLLIYLPPQSDDTEGSGRDARDVVEENISKAQIMYNIIAGTLKKGLKSDFYGQRHFSFEIIGSKGFIHYYATVPVALVEVIKQAIVSAYPAARLEEAEEHNIFSPIGKLSGTVGGELTLKDHFAYPISTYQDLKRDAMQSILNALSTLEKEDGVGIQIMMRPANPGWRKAASSVAKKKREGSGRNEGTDAVMWWFRNLPKALFEPPGEGKDKSDKKDLSSLEHSVLDSIDEKTKYPGYEVLIRVVASSNVSQKAQTILNNVVSAFALFDAQGKNGFKFTPAKDIERFVTAYILRFFPQELNKSVLNAVELATLFHFPDQKNIPTSQLERQASKQVDGPRNVPDEGLLLGYNVFRGAKKPIRLALGDRQRHMYVVGQTGTGKSTFLENMALQDMINGDGFAFVDPHGDTAENLLAMVPKERTEDIIYFCPSDMDYPMGLNLFEFHTQDQKDFLIQETQNMLYKLYDPQRQGIIGPRFERIFTNCALLLMSDPSGGTFVDVPKLLVDPQFMKDKLQYVTDQNVIDFWTKEWPNAQRSNEAGEVTSWVVSKFGAFLSNEMMRNIIGQTKSSFNMREIMDNKKILLVNLSKGRTGDLNSRLLGMIFVMKFQAAAMSRANIPESERKDFCLYVDEFQNFSTDSFATIMSEARKYHLNLVVANQFTTQLSDEIRDAVFGNMGTIVAFRVGQNDVESLTRYFQPLFDGEDLLRVPNYNTIVRTLINGVPTQPFSMSALPHLGSPNWKLSDALKQLTAAKFGRPRATVASEIDKRLATKAPSKPAFGSANPFSSGQNSTVGQPSSYQKPLGTTTPATKPSMSSGSFLDNWLAKRSTNQKAQPNPLQRTVPPASPHYGLANAPTASTAPQAPANGATDMPISRQVTPTTSAQQAEVTEVISNIPTPSTPTLQTQTASQNLPLANSPVSAPGAELPTPVISALPDQTNSLNDNFQNQSPPSVVPVAPEEPKPSVNEVVHHVPRGDDEESESSDSIHIDKDGTLHLRYRGQQDSNLN